MAVASVKCSCESILESYVSQYEVHFNERRNVDELTANEEFGIAVNGFTFQREVLAFLQDLLNGEAGESKWNL